MKVKIVSTALAFKVFLISFQHFRNLLSAWGPCRHNCSNNSTLLTKPNVFFWHAFWWVSWSFASCGKHLRAFFVGTYSCNLLYAWWRDNASQRLELHSWHQDCGGASDWICRWRDPGKCGARRTQQNTKTSTVEYPILPRVSRNVFHFGTIGTVYSSLCHFIAGLKPPHNILILGQIPHFSIIFKQTTCFCMYSGRIF